MRSELPRNVLDLNERIFLFKGFFDRPYDLVNDQRGIPGDLTLFLRAFEQDLLPVRLVVKHDFVHGRRAAGGTDPNHER